MRFPQPAPERPGVDLTPMIDVTFQLIAFFMFVLNFSQVEQDQSIRLPASELAQPSEDSFKRPLTVQLKADGAVLFGGKSLPLSALGNELSREAQVMKRLQQDPREATIIVRADGSVPTGLVQRLIRTCQDAGFENFSLRAKQEVQEAGL